MSQVMYIPAYKVIHISISEEENCLKFKTWI